MHKFWIILFVTTLAFADEKSESEKLYEHIEKIYAPECIKEGGDLIKCIEDKVDENLEVGEE